MNKSKDKFVIFNEWLDTCPWGDYITNKLDYDPKTKYWEFRVKVPGISKAVRDSYTDETYKFEEIYIMNEKYKKLTKVQKKGIDRLINTVAKWKGMDKHLGEGNSRINAESEIVDSFHKFLSEWTKEVCEGIK